MHAAHTAETEQATRDTEDCASTTSAPGDGFARKDAAPSTVGLVSGCRKEDFMSTASEFIKKYKLSPDEFTLEEQLPLFIEEMQRGLDGEDSSMLMIPTYLQPKEDLARDHKIICADMGGTNLRICAAHFAKNGEFIMSDVTRYIMPGVEEELDADTFFQTLAELIAPYCSISHDLVISFAYRTKVTPDIDGEIVEITKEVKVNGSPGKLIAKEMKAAFENLGIPDMNIIVINDSVAVSVAGRGDHLDEGYGTSTGTILGTGSNSCYVEDNANIHKVPDLPPGTMVINTEAGSYNLMPRGALDVEFDEATLNPGIGIAEKMTSGGYIGPFVELVLRRAAAEDVFSTKALEEMEPESLHTSDVDAFLRDGSGLIAEFMVNDEDEAAAREILQAIVDRAAKLVALQMAGCAIKGYKTNDRALLTIEGSMYTKMHGMREAVQGYLLPFLKQNGIEGTVVEPEHAVIKGCAIAGLSAWY